MSDNQRPCVFGYGLCLATAATPADQQATCEDWFRQSQREGKLLDFAWGGWLADAAAAATLPWLQRPFGEVLIQRLRPGDRIVGARYDRVFRSAVDCAQSLERLSEMNVGLVILDADFDTTTIIGRACMKAIQVLTQGERTSIAERTREALQHKRRQLLPAGGGAPLGWKQVGLKKDSRFIPDNEYRRVANYILRLKDEHGLSWADIEIKLWADKVKRPGEHGDRKVYGEVNRNPDGWSRRAVRNAYKAARFGFPLRHPAFDTHEIFLAHLARVGPEERQALLDEATPKNVLARRSG